MTADAANSTGVGFDELDRQAGEFAAVRRVLDASSGASSLSIAICNSPGLRNHLIERLSAERPGIETIALPKDTVDVFGYVQDLAHLPDRSALFLVGIEASIHSDKDHHPTLRSLNASRELWPQAFACPAIIWLPEYAATLLSKHARDFWAWVSHRFEFVTEERVSGPVPSARDSLSWDAVANLDADRKHFRIAELEKRLQEIGDPPPSELQRHALSWMSELGALQCKLGHLDHAESLYRKVLEIEEKLGSLDGMASEYCNLGSVFFKRGDLDQAEAMFQKSLKIDEKLVRLEGMAMQYGNLGSVSLTRGDLDQAEAMYLKSLEIDEQLGRFEGMANQYGNLGIVYHTRNDLVQAEVMYRKSLEINEKLGRLEDMAINYCNLGNIYQTRGDLDQAEAMQRKSLEIDENLGLLEGMASGYGNLGNLFAKRGDSSQARVHWMQARDLFTQVGMRGELERVEASLAGLPKDNADA